MSATNPNYVLHLTAAGEFRLRSAQGERKLSAPESFAVGLSLVQSRSYTAAARVFAALARRQPGNPQFLMMLARCRAGLRDFERCNDILKSLFGDGDCEAVAMLQAAFVFETLGMSDDATGELQKLKLAENHPQMPLLRLLLGDFYARKGNANWALRCWKSALELDGEDGCVAFVARRQMTRLTRRRSAVQEAGHV
jgi:predicted Zn-dependent protease